jgi:ureidoglycolate lyase
MHIECTAIEAGAFAPFGTLIDAATRAPELINDGSAQRHSDLATLDLRGERDPVLGIYVAQARHFPLRIVRLERHRLASQVFLPLGNHSFIVIVAPGDVTPQWPRVTAFMTQPGQGVALKRGCWHHGLVALADGDRFAVIEGGNYRRDTEEVEAPGLIDLVA